MKLELVKMPSNYYGSMQRSARHYIITINDVIIEHIKEQDYPEKSRLWFDTYLESRTKVFEQALGIKFKKVRGAE
jgi:hypothetical protein